MGALCLNLPFGSPNLTPRHSPAQAKPGAAPGAPPRPPHSLFYMMKTCTQQQIHKQPITTADRFNPRYFQCLINFPAKHAELNLSLLTLLTETGGRWVHGH